MRSKFYFSVIRVVPDPVKFEPINVGVVVIAADGVGGELLYNKRIRSRLAPIRRDLPLAGIFATIEDLKQYLGLEMQMPLAAPEPPRRTAGRSRLEAAARYFENQVQLTEPKPYFAEGLRAAADALYARYISHKLPSPQVRREMTAAEMRSRIWNVIKQWQNRNIKIDRDGWLRGPETHARHPADYIIKNGTAKAAFFALATADPDRATTHLYRDSLPTIARDMGPTFVAYAVLPDIEPATASPIAEFVSETRSLLSYYEQVKPVFLKDVPSLEDEVVSRLL